MGKPDMTLTVAAAIVEPEDLKLIYLRGRRCRDGDSVSE